MSRDIFYFRRFMIRQNKCAMKVGTDSMLLGAYVPLRINISVLDIGTGTGVLALMLAQRAKIRVDAVEIDELAFQQARCNIINSSFSDSIQVYHSSVQKFEPLKKYDLIVCNPPFFETSGRAGEYSSINRAIARDSISLSFDDLCASAGRLMQADGSFYIILPADQRKKFLLFTSQFNFHLFDELIIKSFPHSAAKRIILGFSFQEKEWKSKEFIIYSQPGIYSTDYKLLTEEYHATAIRYTLP